MRVVKEKATILGIIFILTAAFSCREIQEKLLPAFSVNIPVIRLTVPSLPFVTDREIAAGAIRTPINLDSTIRANTGGAFGADAVHFVKVKKMVIKVVNADKINNLSNFETARMTLFSDTASADIASVNFPESYADVIAAEPESSIDISKYLRGKNLACNVYWKNRKKTGKSLKLEVWITVSVQ